MQKLLVLDRFRAISVMVNIGVALLGAADETTPAPRGIPGLSVGLASLHCKPEKSSRVASVAKSFDRTIAY